MSAQAVVEAIQRIERELLIDRQRAELSVATPLPAAVNSTREVLVDLAGKPGMSALATESHNHRRALGMAAALAVLGISVVGADWVLLSRRAGRVASATPAPIAIAATDPSPAVPAPTPTPKTLTPIAPPKAAGPPVETQEKVGDASPREKIDDPPREEKIGKAPRETTPDRGGPRPELAEKPGARDPLKPVAVLGEGSRVIDPNGDCRILLNRAENRATITVPGTAHLLSADLGRMNAPRHPSGGPGRVRGPRPGHGDQPSRRPSDDDPVRSLPWGRDPPLAGPGELRPPGDRRGHPQGQSLPIRELRAPPGRPPGHLPGPRDR